MFVLFSSPCLNALTLISSDLVSAEVSFFFVFSHEMRSYVDPSALSLCQVPSPLGPDADSEVSLVKEGYEFCESNVKKISGSYQLEEARGSLCYLIISIRVFLGRIVSLLSSSSLLYYK